MLGPTDDLIKDKHLIIVPSGPLTGLPFNVLVTEPPKTAIPGKLAEYREAAWLGARTAITVLPSVASLKALRKFAKTSRATKVYLGIGNPLLDGDQADPQDKKLATCALASPPSSAHKRFPCVLTRYVIAYRAIDAIQPRVLYFMPGREAGPPGCAGV